MSISALILLNIPDFTVLAALKWVSVGNRVASWWAVAIFRFTFSRFGIQESFVGAANVREITRDKVLTLWARIFSISTLIKLNVPDLAVLAALLWVSIWDWVSSRWAFNGVSWFAFSGLKVEDSFERAADVRVWNEVLSVGTRGIALSRVRIEDGIKWTAGECSIVKRDQESSFRTGW